MKLKVQSQGIPEELKCLQLISSLQETPSLEELPNNQTCLKLMSSIRSYVGSVTENLLHRSFQKGLTGNSANVEGQPPMTPPFSGGAQPSAHVTLIPYNSASVGNLNHLGELPQSCRYPLYNWKSRGLLSHLQNITFKAGVLRVSQGGKYYVYSQIYFRYPAEGEGAQATGQQLVQCISRQTAYRQPILLLKGVATKCWSPEAEYGLRAIYQGGLFELKAGDELLVSVSSLAVDDTDSTSSYFGAFRLAVGPQSNKWPRKDPQSTWALVPGSLDSRRKWEASSRWAFSWCGPVRKSICFPLWEVTLGNRRIASSSSLVCGPEATQGCSTTIILDLETLCYLSQRGEGGIQASAQLTTARGSQALQFGPAPAPSPPCFSHCGQPCLSLQPYLLPIPSPHPALHPRALRRLSACVGAGCWPDRLTRPLSARRISS
ncbi:uncharacterized protein LOC100027207 isoform X2 [Monodelphis domestica]|uniref:uncharacterized protein LOC100027207 isoform X2 n=1 Tax=Monodelphis domestica TaxID=13616 RepID=UPI0024E1FFBE|nr:uncharacterized protein LOC100027207 isoform X2 [Monodelphis domestica]XP_056665532.1 uncharacterized protein LOC100027207 isoform X2 [Monodelphis domestica]